MVSSDLLRFLLLYIKKIQHFMYSIFWMCVVIQLMIIIFMAGTDSSVWL